MNKENILYVAIFSAIVTFVLVTILALIYEGTKEQVALNELIKGKGAVLKALDIPFEPNITDINAKLSTVEELYFTADGTKEIEQGPNSIIVYRNKETGSFAKSAFGPGLWGTIYVVLAYDKNLTKVEGMEITAQSETPGLGGRISEEKFLDQFKGEAILADPATNKEIIKVSMKTVPKGDLMDGKVDGISGATRTSEGIEQIVASDIAFMKKAISKL